MIRERRGGEEARARASRPKQERGWLVFLLGLSAFLGALWYAARVLGWAP